jgi:hypothetical protein
VLKWSGDGITNEDTKVSGTGCMRVYQRARPRITALAAGMFRGRGSHFEAELPYGAQVRVKWFSLDGSDTKCEKNVFKHRVT